jgi:TonB family protein
MSTQTLDTTDLNSSPTRRPGESPRQQSVCIEIPVTVHGSRSASGSLNNNQAAKPFLEETRTMIVFPSGAVLRLTEPVSEGQILILKNPRVKQEVACRVVSSKTNASAKGYVEVEFFQAAPGFWGITFPSAPSSAQAEPAHAAPQPRQTRVEPSASKPAFFQPPVAAPKTPAPVAPVISKPAPVPTPVIPAARAPEPIVAEPVVAETFVAETFAAEPIIAETFVPEPPAPAAAAPFVSAPIESKPFVAAPIISSPITPLTPDSTQELNAAIAAAYRTAPEPAKPIKKIEPVYDAMPVKDSVSVSATPAPSIADILPPPNKTLNPTKPKSAPAAKPSRETFSSSEPLAMAESIGYPGSEFSAYSKSEKSAKQSRSSSSASSSSIENRKLDLTSSQIASETVASKPMFGSADEDSSNEKSGSSKTWLIAAAVVLLLAGGAGAYWWTTTHKLGAASSVSAAPPLAAPTVPAGAAVPGTNPTGANSQPSNNPVSTQNSVATQKPGATPRTAPANSLTVKPEAPSAAANSHRPTVLPSEKIAAPVAHASNSSIAAPDVSSTSSNAPGASLSAILPGMGQPSAGPAPPPAKPTGPLPAASVLQQPRLLQSSPAVYPKIAATRGDWGDVMIDATVGENGQVTDAKVVSGPETLRQSALQVVRTQTYQPAKLNGKPVSMHVTVKVPFPKPR